MHFIASAIGIVAAFAAYGIYRASRGTEQPPSGIQEPTDVPQRRPHLRPLSAREFNRLAESSHAVLFHLMREAPTSAKPRSDLGSTGISIAELQKCLPWVPADEKILLVPDGGLTPSTLKILEKLNTHRDLFLLADIDTNPAGARN